MLHVAEQQRQPSQCAAASVGRKKPHGKGRDANTTKCISSSGGGSRQEAKPKQDPSELCASDITFPAKEEGEISGRRLPTPTTEESVSAATSAMAAAKLERMDANQQTPQKPHVPAIMLDSAVAQTEQTHDAPAIETGPSGAHGGQPDTAGMPSTELQAAAG